MGAPAYDATRQSVIFRPREKAAGAPSRYAITLDALEQRFGAAWPGGNAVETFLQHAEVIYDVAERKATAPPAAGRADAGETEALVVLTTADFLEEEGLFFYTG
ncbi:MAG: DUF1488 family protein [Azospirillaceae bacterium]